MGLDPCGRCGRTLRDVAVAATIEQRRGQAPLCPVQSCPLLQQVRGLVPLVKGREAQGNSPPTMFVGRFGWPKVRLGPVLPPTVQEDAGILDDPVRWRDMPLEEIVLLRSGLLRGVRNVKVEQARQPDKVLDVTQELAMAAKPVDTEVRFNKDVKVPMSPVSIGHAAPAGPSIGLKDARVVDHARIERPVARITDDTDAPARTGMAELQTSGVRVEQVARLLSAGLLGRGDARTFVPTRWSITAADDSLGKNLLHPLLDRQPLTDDLAFQAELHGNRFLILLRPGPWSFEMVEAWRGNKGWKVIRDAEERKARTNYADAITGAYYAARLGVLEWLTARQRQASVTVLRIITPDYFAPAGVWVIREGIRMALEQLPVAKGDLVDQHARAWVGEVPMLEKSSSFQRRQATLDGFGP